MKVKRLYVFNFFCIMKMMKHIMNKRIKSKLLKSRTCCSCNTTHLKYSKLTRDRLTCHKLKCITKSFAQDYAKNAINNMINRDNASFANKINDNNNNSI